MFNEAFIEIIDNGARVKSHKIHGQRCCLYRKRNK